MSLNHIDLSGFDKNKKYRSKVKGRSVPPPPKDHKTHGQFLLTAIEKSFKEYDSYRTKIKVDPLENNIDGLYINIEGNLEDGLKFDSLDNVSFHLCNVKTDSENNLITATVFIPSSKRDAFLKKFQQYFDTSDETTPKNLSLISTIVNLKIADLESFWTDEKNEFPQDGNQQYWWEIWLNKPKNRIISDEEIEKFCNAIGASYSDQRINLKRTVIILVKASKQQLEKSIFLISNLEELKFVGDSPSFFLDQTSKDNQDWIDDLQKRIVYGATYQQIKISILDTGVNYNHPLLSNFIGHQDCCSYGSNGVRWPLYTPYSPKSTHGSLQAGIAIYDNLMTALTSTTPIQVNYSLESGRILPDYGHNSPQMYGYITQNICYQLEVKNTKIKRIFSMAVTASDSTGRPSSWSSAVDNLVYEGSKRLFMISAGNSRNINPNLDNWDNVSLNPIQDPAQAWNAITVGAYTQLYRVNDPNYHHWNICSNPGEVTVSSTSSIIWNWGKNAPIKPEVVFEGGNYLISPCQTQLDTCDELGILTTAGSSNLFDLHRDTSAATAKASKYIAEIVSKYPKYWPETHRAILIHSAEWTPKMKDWVKNQGNRPIDKLNMLRTVGFGVPNLDIALNSNKNKVMLIVEREILPLVKGPNSIQFNEMHLHDIPFPQNLNELVNENPAINAKLKVTLSYFIEPNPSTKIASNKYSYRSIGLIFKVKSSLQTDRNFFASINDLESYTDYEGSDSSNEGWALNNDLRRLGSIHSDVWEGSIADLVNMDKIAILPIFGWWKNPKSEIDEFKVRYSLVISVDIDNEIDIYSGIQSMISNAIKVPNEIFV